MLRPPPMRRRPYAVALVWVGLAALAHLALTPLLGDRFPFVPFYLAVGGSAWYGGAGPGFVTLALGGLVAQAFVDGAGSARTIVGDVPSAIATAVYLGTGCIMVVSGVLVRRRERQAGVAEEEALRSVLALRQEQTERTALEREARDQHGLLGLAHVFIRDMSGRIVLWTPGAEALYGYPAAEAVGRLSHELLATEFPEPLAQIEARVRAEGAWDGSLVHRARDGRRLHVASHWTLRRGMFGRDETIVEVNDDVTAAVGAAAEREHARREEAAILESVAEGIFGVDLHGRCTFVNRLAAEMLGWEPDALAGKDLHETMHRAHGAGVACVLERALVRGERADVARDVVVRRDGSEIPVEYSVAPIRIAGAVHGTVVAMRDITERLRQEAAVRESEDRIRLLIESAHDYAIFTVTRDGTIETWNTGAERVYGFPADEAVGRPVDIVFTPEDRARGAPARELQIAEERGAAPDERWHVRKDGRRFFASGVVRPLPDGGRGPRSFLKIAQDVTPRVEAERERERLLATAEQARREAEEANRAKDDFLAVLSHELRAPLHAMAAWLHILKTSTDGGRQAQAIATLERSLATQTQLINDLLDVSRIITGKLDVDEQLLDLGELVRQGVEASRPAAETKGIELRVECAPGPFPVRGDRKRLAQVLDNLIGNAVKFTPAGGHVVTSVQRVDGDVEVRVTDTGVGMPATLVPHIFERFRQADSPSVRGQGGLGLGLSIVKHLVERHGGTVSAASEGPGRGSTFTVRLPVAAGGGGTEQTAPERPERADLGNVTVLLVEDDPDARAALALVLKEHGATVHEAESTDRAVDIHARERPAVVLSDIAMPGRSGYDLIQRIRDSERDGGASTMAIAMSGFVGRTERERALRAGFDEYVGKPIDPDVLVERLRALLARRRAVTRART